MTADRPLLGILLMLGFCAAIPLADASAKAIGGAVPLGEVVLLRFAAQALILVPVARAMGASLAFGPRQLWLTAVRAALQVLGIGMMYSALRVLPLADAVAIAFVMPFLMLGLGHVLAGEAVGPHRLAACAVGFAGTLMVVQPNFAQVGAAALLPLGVALVYAFFMLSTRAVAREVAPVALQAMTGVVAVPLVLPALGVLAALGWEEAALTVPAAREAWLLAAVCAFGTVAHLLMTWSLRFAPSATLAPMQYLEIPVAALVGWLAFGDLPDGLAAAGIVVTVAAGLYVIWRERISAAAAGPSA